MLISFDPGETTGFVLFTMNQDLKMWGELGHEKEIFKLLSKNSIRMVIIEQFKLYPWRSKALYWSSLRTIEIIGAIKAYCILLKIPFILQDPNAKKFFSNKKLQNLNLYKGFSVHERDAIRHALYYLHFKLQKEIKPYALSNKNGER